MTGFNYTVKQGDKGLSYILLEQAKAKAKADGKDFNAKSINWTSVFSTLKGIQAQEAQEGQKLYYGGDKRMGIKVGQQIDLSAEQMNQIYKSMGLDVEPPSTVNQLPELPEVSDEPEVILPSADTNPPEKDKFPPNNAVDLSNTVISVTDFEKKPQKQYANKQFGFYKFDRNGYCIGQVDPNTNRPVREYQRGADGAIKNIILYQHDENGHMTGMLTCSGDGRVLDQIAYEYDNDGRLTETAIYNCQGYLASYHTKEYKDGQLSREVSYDTSGDVKDYKKYEYNEANTISKEINYNADGSVVGFTAYDYSSGEARWGHYDANGKIYGGSDDIYY